MLLAIAFGIGAGALIPIQTAVNTRLSRHLGAILPASLVSFAVGTLGLGALVMITGTGIPLRATAAGQPWWMWIGGLCGLAFLTHNIVLLPRIGASATVVPRRPGAPSAAGAKRALAVLWLLGARRGARVVRRRHPRPHRDHLAG